MKHISTLKSIEQRERRGERLPGYVAECLRLGTLLPGGFLEFTDEQFSRLRNQFTPLHRTAVQLPAPSLPGWAMECCQDCKHFLENACALQTTTFKTALRPEGRLARFMRGESVEA